MPAPAPPLPGAPPGRLARLRATPATVAVGVLCLAAFAWAERSGGSTDPATLLRLGALAREPVWVEGQAWRLLSAAFLHFGLLHLAANLVFGLPWCAMVERSLGTARFSALYLASAIAGSALSLLGGRAALSVGASGALFGVIGAALGVERQDAGSWRGFAARRGVRLVLANLAVLALAGWWVPIDELAHLGGFVTGGAIGWGLAWGRSATAPGAPSAGGGRGR